MENKLEEAKTFESDMDRRIADSPKDHIPGWGHDANPENDPTFPMKHRTGADYQRLNYDKPPQQPINVEILHSNERPNVTRVFGTSTPPSGLSGQIRRFAFQYSESSYGHWVPLVLADRIGVWEGFISDLRKGIVPNIFAERGWTWEWKHNPQALVKKLVIGVAVTSVVAVLLFRNKEKAH